MTKKKEQGSGESGFTLGESTTPAGAPDVDALPKIDFSTFVISLGTSALHHLGVAANPETSEQPPKNLAMASQTIDTLEMLRDKTRGNLGEEETKLIESVLYEPRPIS
ncbi:MAG: DUF1844 domain-containing protein [Myxococcota bacterium]